MSASIKVFQASRCALAILATFAAAPAWADGACAQWDASGSWTLIQSNDTAVSLNLDQNPNGFSGNASFGRMVEDDFWGCSIALCGQDYVSFSGPVVGTIKGNVFEATIYWSDHKIGVYSGEVGPQGLVVGTAFDKNDPRNTARWHSNRIMKCSASAPAPPAARTGVLLGRVQTPAGTPAAAPKTICEYAASARARNSPAAPALEKQCAAQGGLPTAAASAATESTSDRRATAPVAPVRAPHDLVIGRLSYTQEGVRVTQPVVGRPVTLVCNYFVNEVASAFNFSIQPWQGLVQVGGRAPDTLMFQGNPGGGAHEARLTWTPSAAGETPVSCVLNRNFEAAEANGGNNRWNEVIDVLSDEAPVPASEDDALPPAADDPEAGQAQQE